MGYGVFDSRNFFLAKANNLCELGVLMDFIQGIVSLIVMFLRISVPWIPFVRNSHKCSHSRSIQAHQRQQQWSFDYSLLCLNFINNRLTYEMCCTQTTDKIKLHKELKLSITIARELSKVSELRKRSKKLDKRRVPAQICGTT